MLNYPKKRLTPNKKKTKTVKQLLLKMMMKLHLILCRYLAVDIQRETCWDPGSNTPSTSKVESVNIGQKSGNTYISGYRFMDMDILKSMFSCLVCPECFHQNVTIQDINSKKKGLARYIALKCSDCGFVRHFYTSKMIDSNASGMKFFEVNFMTVYGMRTIRGGFSSLEKC